METKKEIIINIQLALFFSNPLIKPEEFWQSFNSSMDSIFDNTPLIMPVPNDPKVYDIPVVQMNSSRGVYSCNIARNRVDFFVAGVGEQSFSDIKSDLLEKSEKFFRFFSEKSKIKRIGFVSRFFIEDKGQDKTIANLLNDNFKALHNGDVHEVSVRYVSRVKIDSFDINNFTTIEKFLARISGIDERKKGILITRDFNTIQEKNYENQLDWNDIKKIVDASVKKYKLEDIKKVLWTDQ